MNSNPMTLDGARVFAIAHITNDVKPTGATVHRVDGFEVKSFAALAIAQYCDDRGFYLFYCDEHWNVITDTYHDSLEDAKGQAAFEFEGIDAQWMCLN
ncbi:MAG: hypothetical protein KDA88_07485 [Planctomycetaceae bacterium]|nr:hypothetical protein [Planctomycetaceae bacterium]MCB9949669.1 hypothetical protein [Planctomycetaceae bacterium]